jgi:hypothetical protein
MFPRTEFGRLRATSQIGVGRVFVLIRGRANVVGT